MLAVVQLAGHEGSRVVVVGILHGFRDRCLGAVFIPRRHVEGVLLGYPSLADVFVEELAAAPSGHGGILEHQPVGALEVEAVDAA